MCGTRQEDGAVLGEARAACELVGVGPGHETKEAGQTRMRDILVPRAPESPRELSKGHPDTELQQNLGFMNSLGRSPSPPGGTPAPPGAAFPPGDVKLQVSKVKHFSTFPADLAAGGSQAEAGPRAGAVHGELGLAHRQAGARSSPGLPQPGQEEVNLSSVASDWVPHV